MRRTKPNSLDSDQLVDKLKPSMKMDEETWETSQTARDDFYINSNGEFDFDDIHSDDDLKVEQLNLVNEKEALGIPYKMENDVNSNNQQSTKSQKEISEPQDKHEEQNSQETKNIEKSVKSEKAYLPRTGTTEQSKCQK